MNPTISFDDFEKVDIRSGTIVKAEPFPRARKSAYKVWVDFGDDIGIKQTSAQITDHYTPETLVGQQVAGAINLGTRNIAGFVSEFLLLGFTDQENKVCLIGIHPKVPNGQRMC